MIPHFYQNIQGWFTFPKFYSQVVAEAKDNFWFVEIGAWKGKSTCYLATEIANSGKKIKFDCVDTWKGDNDISSSYYEPLLETEDGLYNHFLENINPVSNFVNPLRTTSIEASKLYRDKTLDFVFIDGAHDYKSVKEDINAWLPKIKPNGILSGHDFYHPPVKQALADTLKTGFLEFLNENVWWYKVKQ